MNFIPPSVRAVFFDAVGTLLHPEPSAADAYADVGARFGSRRPRAEIGARFRRAFRRQEELDRSAGLRTSEEREVARWRGIVGEVLDDVSDADACFHTLYEHFARPDAWRLDVDAASTLRALSGRGLAVGLCSNFDHRLRGLVAAMPELKGVRRLVISSEVGWKKPAGAFFAEVARCVELPPAQVLVVGDDAENDFDGARAAGFPALLFDPRGTGTAVPEARIARLSDLVE
jgi:putative hydrolase of the HAD superfamily